jgi:quercetin dioxygenase-like cupin family protein
VQFPCSRRHGSRRAITNDLRVHRRLSANDIKWSAAPSSIPPVAQAAVLYGDPSKEGLFALRLKLPKGYAIAPHSHSKPEVLTVITGTL